MAFELLSQSRKLNKRGVLDFLSYSRYYNRVFALKDIITECCAKRSKVLSEFKKK